MATDPRLEDLNKITGSIEKNTAILHVQVLRGANLYKTDTLHAIDPYVGVRLGSDTSRSITLLRAGSDPVFDWSVAIPFDPRHEYGDGLVLTVWDQDFGSHDDVVGRVALPMATLLPCETAARAFRGKVDVVHRGRLSGRNKKGGSLEIVAYWVSTAECQRLQDLLLEARREIELEISGEEAAAVRSPPPSPLLPLPLNYCVTNFNELAGIARTIIDKGTVSAYTPYRTYSLRLRCVKWVFQGYTKGWNKEYKAAQKIYGTSLSSKSVRAALKLQNFMAYSNDMVNSHCAVHEVSGLASLHKLLQSYYAEYAATRYTYVIMPDSHMHFSVTSKDLATDFLSKHALHAGAAPAVTYSGEFFFDRRSRRATATGTPALVVDNNSGTFAPPGGKLHLLKLLLQLNFGTEMPILALDRGDPLLRRLSEENEIE